MSVPNGYVRWSLSFLPAQNSLCPSHLYTQLNCTSLAVHLPERTREGRCPVVRIPFAERCAFAAAPTGSEGVLDRVTVFMPDHIRILCIINAARTERQPVACRAVVRIVLTLEAMGVDAECRELSRSESEFQEAAVRGGDMVEGVDRFEPALRARERETVGSGDRDHRVDRRFDVGDACNTVPGG